MRTVIIYGKAGSGKTRNAERLRQHFECPIIRDEWNPRTPITPGALHLTTEAPRYKLPTALILSYEEAIARL